MRQCKPFCMGWWPLIVFPLLLLGLTSLFKLRDIEQDIAANSQAALNAPEFEWAKIQTYNRGRDVLITGSAPSQSSIDSAVAKANAAYGVRIAEHNGDALTPPPPVPAELNAVVTGNAITLSGFLKDQTAVNNVVAQAQAAFGDTNVISELSVGDNIAELGSNKIVGLLANRGDGVKTLTVKLLEDTLKLNGEVEQLSTRQSIERDLRRAFGGSVDNHIVVVAPPVKRDTCQDLVNELLSQGKINFDSGKSTISSDSFELLDNIVRIAERCQDASFQVAGHTDNTGNANFNMKLSKQRAEAVVAYLIGEGLSATQFEAQGYGPNKPISDNGTESGRAQNRRIEFKLKN